MTTALINVPDGLANGVIVGVNPLHGLYAAMMGPFTGGLFAGTQRMVVTTTAAASMTAAEALSNVPAGQRTSALFMLVVLSGVFMMLAGVLRLGRLMRFVSYSVTTGLLLGIAVLLILSQLPTVSGHAVNEGGRLAAAIDVLTNLDEADGWSLGVAAATMTLALVVARTRAGKLANIFAVVLPSLLVALMGLGSVATVGDVGEIPNTIPRPGWPAFSQALDVVTGALAVMVVILVQGAGVSQSVPNKDDSSPGTSRDFLAQGAANVASGLFRGLPVGGSLSATAFGLLSGAQSRWTPMVAGLSMAVILIVLPGPVSHIAMPALGALLILAGANSIKPRDLRTVRDGGWHSWMAAGTTFAATLLLPIQAAVAVGVILAALLHLFESSNDVSVVELEEADGNLKERKAPKRLASRRVTVLDVYGHLYYAGAHTFERLLPSPIGATHPVVILRLRGRSHHDATLASVLHRYARMLEGAQGRLYLSGVSAKALPTVDQKLRESSVVKVFPATATLGKSTRAARDDAEAWLASLKG